MNIYKEEKEIQDKVASAYDSVYGSLIAYEDRWSYICEQIGSVTNQNDKFLEIGCGTATLLKHLSNIGFQNLHGFDLSDEAIIEAKNKVPNASFKVANMIDMPYNDNEFDVVIFNGSLHHVPKDDISLAIKESCRILRGGSYDYCRF